MISSSNSLSRGSGMLHQVDDALPHAMSGTELSRVQTELRLLPPEAYQQKSDRVERGRHCYAIKRRARDSTSQVLLSGFVKHLGLGFLLLLGFFDDLAELRDCRHVR